jgi:hypothetical protein
MPESLTVAQLIELLKQYPKSAQVVFLLSTDMALVVSVSGHHTDAFGDLRHLFDPDLEPPKTKIVYLKTEILHLKFTK